MSQTSTGDLIESTLKNMKDLIDANTVIGAPITTPDGATILPVSKVNFGYGMGGGDLPSSQKSMFGGGSGGGVSITPIAFLVIDKGNIKLLPIQQYNTTIDRIVDMAPDFMDKVTGFIDSFNAKKNNKNKETVTEVVDK